MFVPVILGSDKTTVSVGTGDNEFWPIYGSIGNIHNNIRRAHGEGLVLIGFLSISKGSSFFISWSWFPLIFQQPTKPICQILNRRFRRQLFHLSLSKFLESLWLGMETPDIAQCPDGHLQQIIWGLGLYIADYIKQILLACIVQGWCPR